MIAILGAGQLGRMLAIAAYSLGQQVRLLDPAADSPAGQLAEHLVGRYDDPAMLERLAAGAQVATYEFENVPLATAQVLTTRLPVYPPPAALAAAQDRLVEKQFFRQLGIATPPFAPVDSREQLDEALALLGYPAVLKTRRLGYDGKGQTVIQHAADARRAWQELGGQPLILEGFVHFKRELSILAVRSPNGATAFYPLVENHHHHGILRRSNAPADNTSPALQAEAETLASQALAALAYVGVLAIELFEVAPDDKTPNTRLLVNEMAPRVHNSGHWTIEGADTSQFENHLRAILGLPLGSTAPRGASVMLNIIGELPDISALLAIPGAHLHLYGKAPRPGRKLGHITLCASEPTRLAKQVAQAETLLVR